MRGTAGLEALGMGMAEAGLRVGLLGNTGLHTELS